MEILPYLRRLYAAHALLGGLSRKARPQPPDVPMDVLRNLTPDDERTLAHYDREMTAFLEGRRAERPLRRASPWIN
jgi:hypothetical protein